MAVTHIVWIKFHDGVTASRIDEHITALRSLAGEVPGITSLTAGRNFTDRANGYTHGLVVVLEDKAALEGYATHPYHVAIASALREDATLMALDYEH